MWISIECLFFLVIVSVFLTTAEPFQHLLRDRDKGSVYNVDFSIKSGIVKSGFENSVSISMQMILKPYDNKTVFVRIDQKNGSAKSGNVFKKIRDHEDATFNLIPTTEEIKNLDTFEFFLKSEGKIILKKDAKDVNMMKAIASALVFDWEKVNRKDKKPCQYTKLQDTLYGTCRMMPFVKTQKDGSLFVEQNFDPITDCGKLDWRHLTDNHEVKTLRELKGIQISNSRKYEFSKVANIYLMKNLHTQQHIFLTPGRTDEIEHYLHTFYDFQLNEGAEIPVQDFQEDLFDWETLHDFKFASLEKKSLINEDFSDFLSIPRERGKEIKSEVERLLKRIEQAEDPSDPYAMRGDGWEVAEIIDYMKTFSEEELSQIYHMTVKVDNEGDSNMMKNFFRVLPLVGSAAATTFSIKMINSPKAELNREMTLVKLAGNIREVSEESLDSLKNLTSYSPLAYLAYSRALSVIPEKDYITEIPGIPDSGINRHWRERLEFFSEKFSSAKDYEEKRIILQAVGNLNEFRFDSLLQKVIKEEDENLKIHAMYALQKSISKFPEALYNHLINYAIDQDLTTEMRAVAVKIILDVLNKLTSDSQKIHFESLARRLHDDPDHELYNFFASTVLTLIERGVLDSSSKKFLKRLESVGRSRGFYFKTHGDFGEDFSITGHMIFEQVVRELKQIQVDIIQDSHVKYSFLLRTSDVNFITDLGNIYSNFFYHSNFKYEISLAKSSRTIFSRSKECDFQAILKTIMGLMESMSQLTPQDWSNKGIFSLTNSDYFIPMDAGRRLRIFNLTPLFLAGKFALLPSDDDKMEVIFSANATLKNVRGMEVHQPNFRAFQGTREMSSLGFSRQFALDVKTLQEPFVPMVVQFIKNNALVTQLGLWSKKETYIYFNRLNETDIQKTNFVPNFFEVTDGRIYSKPTRKEFLANEEWEDFGVRYYILKDYDNGPPNRKDAPYTLSEMMYQKPFSKIMSISTGDFLVSLMSYIRRVFLLPGTYGVSWKAIMTESEFAKISKITQRVRGSTIFYEFADKEDKIRVKYSIAMSNEFDFEGVRIPAEGPRTGLCFNYLSVWREMPEWSANIYYGTYYGTTLKCPKDQTLILIEGTSKFTGEQIEYHSRHHLTYSQCRPEGQILPEEAENNYGCAKAATMLRDQMIWVRYKDIPEGVGSALKSWATWMFANSGGYHMATKTDVIPPGEIEIGIYRPMHSEEDFEITIAMSEDSYTIKGSSEWIMMDSTSFSGMQHMFDQFYVYPVCWIFPRHLGNETWTHLAGFYHGTIKIFGAKHGEDQLVVKVQYKKQEVIISPRDDEGHVNGQYNVMVNENDIDIMPLNYKKDRLSMITIGDTVFILNNFLWNYYIPVIGYNGKSIFVKGSPGGSDEGVFFSDDFMSS